MADILGGAGRIPACRVCRRQHGRELGAAVLLGQARVCVLADAPQDTRRPHRLPHLAAAAPGEFGEAHNLQHPPPAAGARWPRLRLSPSFVSLLTHTLPTCAALGPLRTLSLALLLSLALQKKHERKIDGALDRSHAWASERAGALKEQGLATLSTHGAELGRAVKDVVAQVYTAALTPTPTPSAGEGGAGGAGGDGAAAAASAPAAPAATTASE